MHIACPAGTIELIDEPTYSFGSADNTRRYPFEKNLAPETRSSSIHGLLLDGEPLAVFANGGGASAVHEHSAVYANGFLYVAVGDSVVALNPHPFNYKWSAQVDPATCFGIYYKEQHRALISHGELEVARVSEAAALISARLAEDGEATILTLGDSVYPNGTPAEFAECYEPTWSRFKARTYPSPGNHDYKTPQAAGYFGAPAGTAGLGYCV